MKTVLFNPYTGTPRHPSDIASDPAGLLILDYVEPLRAAPQAQAAGQDERAAFEAAMLQKGHNHERFQRDDAGEYFHPAIYAAWQAWQARAALAQRQPLTKAEIHALVTSAWGADSWVVQAVLDTQRACAEKWGVKLGATTGEQRNA